ncbi:MAG: DUF2179 domain-containing protein [Prevotellaceae bacterium]|jgi:uncharacterized protein YebE (UPF0316 family)|nr:DUF2179 domain-containing protein [Prevotellaceae bacterium]
MFGELMRSDTFVYIVLPILIFCARICDVTLGTLRIIFLSKGYKYIAPVLGFFEILIWVMAISQLLSNMGTWVAYIAYAGGYATGNLVGMMIEERIAIGTLLLRITTPKGGHELMKLLGAQGFGVTLIDGEGSSGKVSILQTVTSRKMIKKVEEILVCYDPNLFYTIEDVRMVKRGIFPPKLNTLRLWRPGK